MADLRYILKVLLLGPRAVSVTISGKWKLAWLVLPGEKNIFFFLAKLMVSSIVFS